MTEPLSWRALEAIKTQLQAVTVANGYRTDLGENVSLESWAVHASLDSPYCVVQSLGDSINEQEQGRGRSGPRVLKSEMDVVIEYAHPATELDAMLQAHRAREDIVRAVRNVPDAYPSMVTGITVVGRQIIDTPDGLSVVLAQITLRVQLVEPIQP